MHGVVLKKLGHNVHIIEAREPDQLGAEAAGLSLGPHAQELMNTYVSDVHDFAITTPATQILSFDGKVLTELPVALSTVTSRWSTVYSQLKAAFEAPASGKGKSVYETATRAASIVPDGEKLTVVCKKNSQTENISLTADMVISADGAQSSIRKQVLEGIAPKYAGYLAWRGHIPESRIPTFMKGTLDGKLCMLSIDGSYIIA